MQNQPPPANQPAATGRQWFRLASLARLESLRQLEPAPSPAPAPTAPPPPPPVPFVALPPAQAEPVQPPPARPQPQLPPSPSPRTTDGSPSTQPQTQMPPMPQPTPTPLPPQSPVGSQTPQPRPPTPPPQSPRVIKQTSADPLPESPKIQHQLPRIKAPTPRPEPEHRPSPAPTPTKNMFMQHHHLVNNSPTVNAKTIADDINDRPPVSSRPPSPKQETSRNGTGWAATSAWRRNDEGGEMKVITMAGENMGAYMEIGKHQPHGHLLHHHRTNSSESQGEDGKPDKGKKPISATTSKGKPIEALVNNNAQSINNSIIFRSSCTQQSPGVHMTLLRQQHPKHKGSH